MGAFANNTQFCTDSKRTNRTIKSANELANFSRCYSLDRQFSTGFSNTFCHNQLNTSAELVTELSMEVLQEMFFFAYPEQRNSTKGSLQVYLVCASNIPKSLATIAVCTQFGLL